MRLRHSVLLASLSLVAACGRASQSTLADDQAPDQQTDGTLQDVTVEAVDTPPEVVAQLESGAIPGADQNAFALDDAPAAPGALGEAQSAVNLARDIFNLGRDAFNFIRDNRGTIDTHSDFASALPRTSTALDLSGWSSLQYRSFRLRSKNTFGITMVDVTITVVHQYGGRYHGIGQYLTNVSVYPSSVWTFWGVSLAGDAHVGSVTNVGTDDAPIAGLVLQLHLRASSWVNATEKNMTCEFRGDSATASCN